MEKKRKLPLLKLKKLPPLLKLPKVKQKELVESEIPKPRILPKLEIKALSRPKLTHLSFLRANKKPSAAPLPALSIAMINPWDKVVERMNMCNNSLEKGHLEFAETFFYEVKPFFKRLDFNQQNLVYPYLVDLQQRLIMLRMQKVKNSLKRYLFF
jgi:hypothetical protein